MKTVSGIYVRPVDTAPGTLAYTWVVLRVDLECIKFVAIRDTIDATEPVSKYGTEAEAERWIRDEITAMREEAVITRT